MSRLRWVLSLAGLALALVGVVRHDRTLVWIAIGAIMLSIGLRILGRRP